MWNWVQNQLLWKCRCSYFNGLVACQQLLLHEWLVVYGTNVKRYWSQRVFSDKYQYKHNCRWLIDWRERKGIVTQKVSHFMFLADMNRMQTKWNGEIVCKMNRKESFICIQALCFHIAECVCVFTTKCIWLFFFYFRFVSISVFANSWRLHSGVHSLGWHTIERYQSRVSGCFPRNRWKWQTIKVQRRCKAINCDA